MQTLAHVIARGLVLTGAVTLSGCCTFRPCLEDIRPPASATGSAPVPVQETSQISIPISLKMDVQKAVNAVIPPVEHHGMDSQKVDLGSNVFLRYNVWRDDVKTSYAGSSVTASARLYYWAAAVKNGWMHLGDCGTGNGPRRADVSVSVNAVWDEQWALAPAVNIARPTFVDECNATVLGLPLTSWVLKPYVTDHIPQWQATLRDAIKAASNVRPQAEVGWKALAAPIALGQDWTLLVHPVAVALAPPNFSATSIDGGITVTARPQLLLGTPPVQSEPALPALGTMPTSGALVLNGQVVVPFTQATELVKKSVGLPYELGAAGLRVKISDLQLYGSPDRVILKLVLEEPARGAIFLQGRPTYEPNEDGVKLDDFDFTLETKNVVAQLFDWVLHTPLRQTFEAVINHAITEKAKAEMQVARLTLQALANKPISDNARLDAKIERIGPIGQPLTTADALFLPIQLKAQAKLLLKL